MTDAAPSVSIVVPLYEAEERILQLHQAVSAQGNDFKPDELVLVDDGSTDRTWLMICELAAEDPTVVGVQLAENVGQTGALCAGFSIARGEIVLMMDDDLDTDPVELPRFITAIAEGADFASGWRQGSRSAVRQIGSDLFNWRVQRWNMPFHDAGCGTNAMTRELALQIAQAGWGVRQHRFKPAVSRMTRRIVEVPFQVRPTTGSHFNARTLASSWLDVELNFTSLTPLRFAAAAIAGPATAAAWFSWRSVATPRRRLLPAVWAIASAGVAAFALDVLMLRLGSDRRDAARPPFSIAEVVARTPADR